VPGPGDRSAVIGPDHRQEKNVKTNTVLFLAWGGIVVVWLMNTLRNYSRGGKK
jgi:hypothetical protein